MKIICDKNYGNLCWFYLIKKMKKKIIMKIINGLGKIWYKIWIDLIL